MSLVIKLLILSKSSLTVFIKKFWWSFIPVIMLAFTSSKFLNLSSFSGVIWPCCLKVTILRLKALITFVCAIIAFSERSIYFNAPCRVGVAFTMSDKAVLVANLCASAWKCSTPLISAKPKLRSSAISFATVLSSMSATILAMRSFDALPMLKISSLTSTGSFINLSFWYFIIL